MPFECPPLPYDQHALEPMISAETLAYHHGKHHQAYVNKLNAAIEKDPDLEGLSLEELIKTKQGGVFNNAAQVWNHTFYWHSMSDKHDGRPQGELLAAIERSFGSVESLQSAFLDAAANNFASGWTWLIREDDGSISILSTDDADTPIRQGKHPILTVDVWEHAYYIDTRNNRPAYLNHFWRLINWDFVSQQYLA